MKQHIVKSLVIATSVLATTWATSSYAYQVETHVYKQTARENLEIDIYYPDNTSYTELPILVYYHGGGFTSGNKDDLLPNKIDWEIMERFLENGYAAASVNYTLIKAKHGTTIFDTFADSKDALRWLNKSAGSLGIDASNMGVIGYSAGGSIAQMIAMAEDNDFVGDAGLSSYSGEVNFIISLAGGGSERYKPEYDAMDSWDDLPAADRQNIEEKLLDLGATTSDSFEHVMDLLRQVTTVTYVDSLDPAVVSMHGEDDTKVEISNPETFHAKLDAEGVDNIFYRLPGEGHGFGTGLSQTEKAPYINEIYAFGHSYYGSSTGGPGPSPGYALADASFENPINIDGRWGMCPTSWNDSATNQNEVANDWFFSAAADGNWYALLSKTGLIYQDLSVWVNAGDTLQISFYGGRSKDGQQPSGGGELVSRFNVGGAHYSMTADTSLQAQDSWQLYTHTITVTNSGNLVVEFDALSGKPWLDGVSNVTVSSGNPNPAPGELINDDMESFNTTGWVTDWIQSTENSHSSSTSLYAGPSQNDLVSPVLDTSGKTSLTISFWYRIDGIDADDDVRLQLFNGSYIDIEEIGDDAEGTWLQYKSTATRAQYPTLFRSDFRMKIEASSIGFG